VKISRIEHCVEVHESSSCKSSASVVVNWGGLGRLQRCGESLVRMDVIVKLKECARSTVAYSKGRNRCQSEHSMIFCLAP
jgi:hypothetical protein